MTQRSSVTIKASNSNESRVSLRLPLNVISNSNNETNFLYKLLLNDRKVLYLRKTFAKKSLTKIKPSRIQIQNDFLDS